MQQKRWLSVVPHHQIHETVVIEIGKSHATAHVRRLHPTAGLPARFDELSVAFIVKQRIELLVAYPWHGLLDLGIDVTIRDERVQPAMVVIVAEGYAHGGHNLGVAGHRHTSGKADFFERAVVFVVIEVGVEPVVGDENIRPAVVVVVGRAHREILAPRLVDFRRARHVGEGAIAFMMIEHVGTPRVRFGGTTAAYGAEITAARILGCEAHVTAHV